MTDAEFVRHEPCNNCGSSDANSLYTDGHYFCFSCHTYTPAEGINLKCIDANTVEVSGSNKTQVGQVAADIRSFRKPEPYKGKGIKYENEYIFRKEGKKK